MDHRPRLALIAAIARHGAIGKNNALLWHESEDLRRFRRVTMGCPVIMGRKTWDSLPPNFRPLPGRRNLVLSRDRAWRAEGAEAVPDFAAALAAAHDAAKAFVIGGAQLYALALPQVDELVLTEIDADFDADTFFPPWDRSRFVETERERHTSAHGVPYSFVTYKRIGG
ncbi:MAG TPA: dihydrofolate reductase [Burkholderiaceae bacterium]|nr:dihydrofolate reductase [Burkholderiaceae bacterium]